ncbi:hypothetical protein A0128_15620 [Leptospira tipperaryensis]|uniref:Lipoprotein n=1 Tax=Leptospira tipperaryensis TaxID=2564040 RepID=A0A1D7UZY1_9LEPT|nr:TIGR04452 family lipoprotein [Leptospira tipperaryensis]AOP35144.1 hypothetical protein A0128_15620 [Leptospira tipperaryensis]
MKNILIVFLLIVTMTFSCSGFYDLVGSKTVKSTEAAFQLQDAVFIGMVTIVGTTSNRLGSLTSISFIDSVAGIDAKDTSALYEKKKVDACADSILSSIVLTSNIDSGLIAASSCKLKKLP